MLSAWPGQGRGKGVWRIVVGGGGGGGLGAVNEHETEENTKHRAEWCGDAVCVECTFDLIEYICSCRRANKL